MSTAKVALIAVAGAAAGLLFTLVAVAGDERAVFVTLALYVGGIALVSLYGKFTRRSAIEREARRLGMSFSRKDPFRVLDGDFHPFLRFGKLPGSQRVENVVWGVRDGREVRAFDYRRPSEDESIRYSCAMVRIPEGCRLCWSVVTAHSTSPGTPRGYTGRSLSWRPSTDASRFVRTTAGWPRR
jgi:hypothetical protein